MVLYWDASAVLSVLLEDAHSATAQGYARKKGVHFLSSLAATEVCAVLRRMKHEGALTDILHKSAIAVLENGPWRRLSIQPEWNVIKEISSGHVLKGADLWHLAAVKSLKAELPEVQIITFDKQLLAASRKEQCAT